MMPSTVEFLVTPTVDTRVEDIDRKYKLAAENIASVLNALAPEQLELINQQLLQVTAPVSNSTATSDALVVSLTNDLQLSSSARQELELVSLLRSFEWRRKLLADALSASQVAVLLGTTRQTPHDRVKSNSLLAVLDRGVWRFPTWQFDPNGPDGVISGLPEVLKALQVSSIAKVSWLVRPNPFLDGLTPIEALKRGEIERVRSQAMATGVK